MRNRPWFRRAIAGLVLLLAASVAFSRVLRAGRVHRYLNARLEATLGRPVEVGEFDFSWLKGPRLEANFVTVAEDPRFGYEYFLRAERLAAGPRWCSLLRGRFEFGTLALTRPSLNLVRAGDGHWNVESWQPPPAASARPACPPARLYRIEVDAGRINFKRGADKLAFSLVDVKGHLEQEAAGRWRMDLEARPVRAAVALQEAGTVRVRGRIAGTSARLQPAELSLTWQDASLADALRLWRGRDFGVRGSLAVEMTARIEAPETRMAPDESASSPYGAAVAEGKGQRSERALWSFTGKARLGGVHRWDLPQRPGDPALDLVVEGQWQPGKPRVEFRQCVLEASRSSARAKGEITWVPSIHPQFRFVSSAISLTDLLAWYRAFQTGVPGDLSLDGNTWMDFVVSGWPPRLEQGVIASAGASLRTVGLPEAIHLGRFTARVRRGRLELEPVIISLPAGAPGAPGKSVPVFRAAQGRQSNSLRVEGAIGPRTDAPGAASQEWDFELNLAGQTDRAQDLLTATAALGHRLNRGWTVEGPLNLRLRWQGSLRPFAGRPLGIIELRGQLRARYLNQPLSLGLTRIELRPSERRVDVSAAQGFGARWKGSLWSRPSRAGETGQPWEFDLTAGRLDAAELDRWLGPRARAGLLERVVPFAAAYRDSSELDELLRGLRARGRLTAEEFVLAPLRVRGLRADVEVAGRNVTLQQARGEFYGGGISGSLSAQLTPESLYDVQVRFERVNLGSLTEDTANLKERFTGSASGKIHLAARGVGRDSLLRSLEGRGTLQVQGPQWRGLDLKVAFLTGGLSAGTSRFAAAGARFSLAERKVQVQSLRLTGPGADLQAEGSVDFSRNLEFRVRSLARPGERRANSAAETTLRLTGPLDAPQATRIESPTGKR